MSLGSESITTISVDSNYRSIFTKSNLDLKGHGDLWISEQQQAVNFRYRKSPSNYRSDWHVAGDPTLIIVSHGCLELELQDGSKKQFSAGDRFIAADYLPNDTPFNPAIHGHRAIVIGEEEFAATHIKLAKRMD